MSPGIALIPGDILFALCIFPMCTVCMYFGLALPVKFISVRSKLKNFMSPTKEKIMKHAVTSKIKIVLFVILAVFVVCSSGQSQVTDYEAMSKKDLQAKIASLGLGFDSYIVGKQLTPKQMEISKKDNGYKAYPGTVKFRDGKLFVIADTKSHVVIALYQRNKKATRNDFKDMIGTLMLQYGEPTTEAHGKTIYWNFGEDGFITEELYRSVKSQGQLEKLIILATVKFTSSENISSMTDMIEKMDKKNNEGKVAKVADTTSDQYVMIQSDILTKKYIKK